MSALRPFRATDLFDFNNINLDVFTETYSITFYLTYLSRWPELCCMQAAPSGRTMGYVVGKAEGTQHDWHGHVTAISVAPEYRRLGLAQNMMDLLERVSDNYHRGFFVDLFVKTNNKVAIPMYERMGYSVWRRIRGYYQGKNGDPDEDAYDMRKSLSRDPGGRFVRANGRDMIFSPDGITM